jgi:hypothetical protein
LIWMQVDVSVPNIGLMGVKTAVRWDGESQVEILDWTWEDRVYLAGKKSLRRF